MSAAAVCPAVAATTFYRRHKGQAAVLIGAKALMIVGAFPVRVSARIVLTTQATTAEPSAQVSVVAANGRHWSRRQSRRSAPTAVERVIPDYALFALGIFVPPIAPPYPVEPTA